MRFSDSDVARKYLVKEANAKTRGLEFDISFTTYARIVRSEKCQLSGLPLCKDTVTIDRIDNSRGYITGNVVACHLNVNTLKGTIEGHNVLSIEIFNKALTNTISRLKNASTTMTNK